MTAAHKLVLLTNFKILQEFPDTDCLILPDFDEDTVNNLFQILYGFTHRYVTHSCSENCSSIPPQSFTQRRKQGRSAVGLACRHNPAVVATASAVTRMRDGKTSVYLMFLSCSDMAFMCQSLKYSGKV